MVPLARSRKIVCLLAFFSLLGTPATAHQVQRVGEVSGLLHIEPQDNLKAGRSTLIWIALTSRGGQIIPLARCDCHLTVYRAPHAAGSPALQTPPLRAISVRQYQGILGAKIVFPTAGAYELDLSGAPRAGGKFKSFSKMSYTVTATTSTP